MLFLTMSAPTPRFYRIIPTNHYTKLITTRGTDADRDMRILVSYCLTFRVPWGNYLNINLHHYHHLDIIKNIESRLGIFLFLFVSLSLW